MNLSPTKKCAVAAILVSLITANGCRDAGTKRDASVTGVVTINGELAKSGSISFQPKGLGPTVYGTISGEGSYRLRTGKAAPNSPEEAKVPSGLYRVVLRVSGNSQLNQSPEEFREGPPELGKLLIPAMYLDADKTPLEYIIKPGDNVINIDIEFDAEELEGEADQDVAEESVEDAEDESEESENDATTEPQLEGASS